MGTQALPGTVTWPGQCVNGTVGTLGFRVGTCNKGDAGQKIS